MTFNPDSSNWANSVASKGEEVSSVEELILEVLDILESSPKHRNSHNMILNCANRTDNALEQTQQFRSVLIMSDYVTSELIYQLSCEAQVDK